MHPRYHYWTYRVAGTIRQLISRRGNVLENPLVEAVIEALAEKLPYVSSGERKVTVVEDMKSGMFGLAIQHPRDTYAKRIGKIIAEGRLVKKIEA